jgi:hypothetical protein
VGFTEVSVSITIRRFIIVEKYGGMRDCGQVFSLGRLPPVRRKVVAHATILKGLAVNADKFIITEFRGSFITSDSRGTDCAVCDGKTKIRAGLVRPAVAVWRRGRQEAALQQKKPQTRTFAVFSTFWPPATVGGCPSPFEPLKDGFATGA